MSAPLAFDRIYLTTTSGVLRICCIILLIVGLLCIFFSTVRFHNFRGMFYIILSLFCILCSTLMLVARLFQLWQRKFYTFNALKWEAYLNGFLALVCFIISAVALSLDMVSYSIATFFGLLAFCLYTFDAILGYQLSRKCDAATQTTNAPVARCRSKRKTETTTTTIATENV